MCLRCALSVVRFGRSPLLWTHPHTVDIASFGDESRDYLLEGITRSEPWASLADSEVALLKAGLLILLRV